MKNYFMNVTTIEELKKQYKKLAMEFHPDRGGNTATFQEIQNEYEIVFDELNTTEEKNNEYKDIINAMMNMINVEIEICGTWIWVSGNTYVYKNELKELGFSWANNKKAWYFKPTDYIKKSRKKFSLEEIRQMHGSEKIKVAYALA